MPSSSVPASAFSPASSSRASYHPEASEPTFVGRSSALADALQQVERFAPYEQLAVLIEGESGTGKSFFARRVHERSPRARGIFHQVVLSTIQDSVAASELFGHVSGAYTDARQSRPGHFVTANRGTLFLDEIGKASESIQQKLLHAVEHKEIWPVGSDRAVRLDVRLVVATNVPVETLVEQGKFLDDLAARLVSFRVRLPALRDRREDIPALVRQFVARHAASCGHPVKAPTVSPELMEVLKRAPWPRNVRQLDNAVQRLLIEAAQSSDRELTLAHCVTDLAYLREGDGNAGRRATPADVRTLMKELGSATAVARKLGVSRWTVYRYLEKDTAQSIARA